ncbi:ORF1284 [White spot syndrome virus]|uniref:ORF1284 n=1 Tax=White spot syndrome virus TaxID=342409 RepID=A0A2D3I5N6_9VIRU|nr:ORF1284 [White spot syndrome virus]
MYLCHGYNLKAIKISPTFYLEHLLPFLTLPGPIVYPLRTTSQPSNLQSHLGQFAGPIFRSQILKLACTRGQNTMIDNKPCRMYLCTCVFLLEN